MDVAMQQKDVMIEQSEKKNDILSNFSICLAINHFKVEKAITIDYSVDI